MKKLTCVILIVLGLVVVAFAPHHATAAGEGGTVTGAGQAAFGNGAILGSTTLSSLDFGTGVFIEPNGSATGAFGALLTGRSVWGQLQQITIEGNVLQGALASGGQANFSGTATVNLGNGTPSLSGVAFTVTTTADSVMLTLDSTRLPAAGLRAGAITVK